MVGILRRSGRARAGLAAAVVIFVLAVLLAWHHFSGRESTDDAQIDAHVNPVAARVGGTVQASPWQVGVYPATPGVATATPGSPTRYDHSLSTVGALATPSDMSCSAARWEPVEPSNRLYH